MSAWDSKWLDKIRQANILLELPCRYMDDGRAVLYPVRAGWRWTGSEIEWRLKEKANKEKAITSEFEIKRLRSSPS
jgi:hypothetical protein